MKIRNSWRLYPLWLLLGLFFYFHFTGTYNRTKFYERSINEKVIDSSSWQTRTIEYYLENGLSINITVLDRIDLKVGDSIVKGLQTNQFKVYRKESDGKYKFHKHYTLE